MSQSGSISPRARYDADLKNDVIEHDPAQQRAVDALDTLYQQLVDNPPKRLRRHWPRVDGLYLWGGVGRGKTYLMDCFYNALPFSPKRRTHFHRFMQGVHEARKRYKNHKDPLRFVARDLAQDRVLCFDEFYVSDIADAMLLGRLMDGLYARGVTLVATSNSVPDNLYAGGLQRDRFVPAIEQIKQHCHVLEVDGGIDYRLRHLERAGIYHCPADDAAEKKMANTFHEVAGHVDGSTRVLQINGREIPVRAATDAVAWFGFDALCTDARSAADYGDLADHYPTVLVSGVPVLGGDNDDQARRFVNLVDEFYDRGIKLILSAQAQPEAIYHGKRLAFEFRRTSSRLREMRTREYLAQPHVPGVPHNE